MPAQNTSKKLITFYFIHLPVLALAILLLVATGYISYSATNVLTSNEDAIVLGDEDEKDDEKEDEHEDEKDDKHEDEKDDEKEDEHEDKNDDNDEFVVNSDGTRTITKREVEDDSEHTETTTYDVNGNKIKVEKYEAEDGESKNRVKFYDESGLELSDHEFETEDGKKIEIKIKDGKNILSHVKYNVENQVLEIETEQLAEARSPSEGLEANNDHAKVRVRVVGDDFVVTRSGADVLSSFPLVVNDETGKISVDTPSGLVALNAMPDSIVEKVKTEDSEVDVHNVKLESDSETELKYVVSGTKSKKLLGVFDLKIPSSLSYDARTGTFLGGNQDFVSKILDLFSV